MADATNETCELCETLTTEHHNVEMSSITKGVLMSTGSSLFRSPLLWFAVGAAAGYYGYKHRKELAATLAKAGDVGRDFVQQQRENLEDLLEEARESEEAAGDESAESPAK
jgi:hypothetical protein